MVAAETVALVAPKNTILLAGIGSKLVPVIVTVVPMGPEVGVNEVMVGIAGQLWPSKAEQKNICAIKAVRVFIPAVLLKVKNGTILAK